MNCPACRAKLKEATYEKVEVDLCESCSGVWLDHREIDLLFATPDLPNKLLETTNQKPLMSVPEGSRTCPRCKEFLYLVTVDKVPLDVCGDCHGFFLDSGEFEHLADAAEVRHAMELRNSTQLIPIIQEAEPESEGVDPNLSGWQESLALACYRVRRWYNGSED